MEETQEQIVRPEKIVSLADRAEALANKLGLGDVAKEARSAWRLAETGGESWLSQIRSLPLAVAVTLETNLLHTSEGQNLEVPEALKNIGAFVFPNQIGWKTIVGGVVGGVILGGVELRFQPRNPFTGEWGEEKNLRLGGLLRITQFTKEKVFEQKGGEVIRITRTKEKPRQVLSWTIGALTGASIANRFLEK